MAETKTKASTAKKVPAKAPAKVKTAAKAAPAAPKSAAKPAAQPAVRRSPARKAAAVDLQRRQHYVEVAAYFIAERRGFHGGSDMEDWVAAEAEIDRLLAEGKLSP